jgi:hypothetical protein
MSGLSRRIEALEERGAGTLVLLLVSWLPGCGREATTYEGVTYTQEPRETGEQFRDRLRARFHDGKQRFVWVSELDAAL